MFLSWSSERMQLMLFLHIIVYIHGKHFSLYSCGQLFIPVYIPVAHSLSVHGLWRPIFLKKVSGHFRISLSIWGRLSPDVMNIS